MDKQTLKVIDEQLDIKLAELEELRRSIHHVIDAMERSREPIVLPHEKETGFVPRHDIAA